MERVDHTTVQFCVSGNGYVRKGAFFDWKARRILDNSFRDVSHLNISTAVSLNFSRFIGLFVPLPFWLVWKFSKPESRLAKAMKYINIPVLTLYIGWYVAFPDPILTSPPES